MADASRRRRILEALRERLEAITRENGYETDAGGLIFIGEAPPLGPDDPDAAICIRIGDDATGYQGEHIVIDLPVEIVALVKADLENDEPWLLVEDVLADATRAVELPDRTLGGLVRRQFRRGSTKTYERTPGSAMVGAGVTYEMPYNQVWGHPEA